MLGALTPEIAKKILSIESDVSSIHDFIAENNLQEEVRKKIMLRHKI